MDLHGFVDIHAFRVRLPTKLYPYRGQEIVEIEACRFPDVPQRSPGWLEIGDLKEFFPSKFSEKNALNIPGPVYGAETDSCCTGPQEAPDNVLIDKSGREFVFRQASNPAEFRDLVSAAMCECFDGYGADGNSHWRLSTIRDWWRTREDMLREEIGEEYCKAESVLQWRRGLQGEAAGYLRVYAFFVENGRIPLDGDILPEIA